MKGEVQARLAQVRSATDRLLQTVGGLEPGELNAPSLCDGWTKGHVLAHIALNADSLVNLFTWAATGVETPQYPSWERRDTDIDRFSTRTVEEHLEELRASAQRYTAAALAVPDRRWSALVAGIGSELQPASNYLGARRREVEVHHWDLDAGYGPRDWPDDFVAEGLELATQRFAERVDHPFELEDRSSGRVLAVGAGAGRRVLGEGADLLAWMLGRNRGEALETSDGRPLPTLGSWG